MRIFEVNTWDGTTWTWAVYQLDEFGEVFACWNRGRYTGA